MKKTRFTITLLAIILMAAYGCILSGCQLGHQSATSQILEQTNDPALIALASYSDGLAVYERAQDAYLPYQNIIKSVDPDLAKKIHDRFQDAWDVLKKWKNVKTLPVGDRDAFEATVKTILFDVAAYIDSH